MLNVTRRALAVVMLAVLPASAAAQLREERELPAQEQSATTQNQASPAAAVPAVEPGFARSLAGDFRRVFARDNISMGVALGAAALASTRWDRAIATELQGSRASVFRPGNAGGAMLMQAGGAAATLVAGSLLHSPKMTALGSELLRAQLVSQAFVQALKVSSDRLRPDTSNRLSLPSGHTASAFATASVLERRFGWKLGAPAYAFGGYVAASRMASGKHYLSDVLVGAAIGIAAGHAATVGVGRTRFDIGVAPTTGGALLTFTKQR